MVKLAFPSALWTDLQVELRRRGKGYRESGAFLLGNRETKTISECVYYDDLDPNSLNQGFIYFNTNGYAPLWRHCHRSGIVVLADIHTHPQAWVDQSLSDRTHPMISSVGHIAFILPYFARRIKSNFVGTGIHLYLGNYTWEKIHPDSDKVALTW